MFNRERDHIFRWHVRRANLVGARFGNIPVLAEKTAHVASGRAHRKDARAWQKMAQRLFLNWIDLDRSGMRVAERIQLSALIGANEAESGLALADVAVARAKIAMHFAVCFGFPPARSVQFARFLQRLQGFHGSSPIFLLYAVQKPARNRTTDASISADTIVWPPHFVNAWFVQDLNVKPWPSSRHLDFERQRHLRTCSEPSPSEF